MADSEFFDVNDPQGNANFSDLDSPAEGDALFAPDDVGGQPLFADDYISAAPEPVLDEYVALRRFLEPLLRRLI
jgi:hypothetical protein